MPNPRREVTADWETVEQLLDGIEDVLRAVRLGLHKPPKPRKSALQVVKGGRDDA